MNSTLLFLLIGASALSLLLLGLITLIIMIKPDRSGAYREITVYACPIDNDTELLRKKA